MSDEPSPKRTDRDLGPMPSMESLAQGIDGRWVNAKLRAAMFGSKTAAPMLGPYQIEAKLGEGGVGQVYCCVHPQTGARVAVKVLRDETELAAQRIRREARAMSRLRHPNVVGVHEIGRCDEGVFIAMELVEGPNMRTWIGERRTPQHVVSVIAQTASGLQAAHDLGLVHRDIKPDNILVDSQGRARITDFGLVKALPDSETHGQTTFGQPLTATGAMLGTLGYMAPEQLRGAAIGPSVDQFSLAATAFEALCQQRAFKGRTSDAVALAILRGKVQPPNEHIPGHVHAVLARAMSVEHTDRFDSVAAFADAFAHCISR